MSSPDPRAPDRSDSDYIPSEWDLPSKKKVAMDAFTKRFYKKGNETNKKEGINTFYPVDKKKSIAKKMTQSQLRKEHGTRLLSKKESAEKTKNWPRAKKHSKEEINKFLGE